VAVSSWSTFDGSAASAVRVTSGLPAVARKRAADPQGEAGDDAP